MISKMPHFALAILLVGASCFADDLLDERLARIEAMSPAEKSALLKNQERFSQLTPQEQEKLRTLAGHIESSPDADHLKQVMAQYTQWLSTLSVGQRAELRSLPAKERIERIRKLIAEQQREEVKRLTNVQVTDEDLNHLRNWAQEYLIDHIEEFTKLVPREMLGRLGSVKMEDKGKIIMFAIARRLDEYPFPAPEPEKLTELKGRLSKPAVNALNKVGEPREQTRLVLTWLRTAAFARFYKAPTDEELQEFYRDKLSQSQRDELDGLSVEEAKQKLQEFYRHYTQRRRWGRPGGGGPRPPDGRDNSGGRDGLGGRGGPDRGDRSDRDERPPFPPGDRPGPGPNNGRGNRPEPPPA